MILAWLLLLTGLTISSVAIYYSVVGLTAIFSAAAVPIMIMGVSLEVAKLVCATWIKQYWTQVPRLMKTYMVVAVTVLMLITSMGIFGFLSKAHNDQNLVSGDVQSKIAIYDEKIKTAKDNIDANRRALKQMDESVDQVMGRSQDEKGADKAVALRRGQAKERTRLLSEITAEQKVIAQLSEERAPIAAEVRKVEAEVGPIKYIAKFIYGETGADENMLEKAVTWIIILIVIVFDPLAVIMLLAAQMTFGWIRKPKSINDFVPQPQELVVDEPVAEPESTSIESATWPFPTYEEITPTHIKESSYEPDNGALTTDQVDQINDLVADTKIDKEPEYFIIEDADEEVEPPKQTEEEIINEVSKLIAEETLQATEPVDIPNPRTAEAAPGLNRGVMYSTPIQADNDVPLGKSSNTGFGNEFPDNPEKGDVHLRVDFLPNRLFKYNGQKWIEVDKSQTDVYAYEEEYIKHLINEIDAGKYDPDILTDIEREQIKQYLSNLNNPT
jgi:hypothetical protein